MNPAGPSTGPPFGGGDTPRSRRDRGAFAVGFAISAVAHVGFVLLYALAWDPLFQGLPAGRATTTLPDLLGTEILVLLERSEPEPLPEEVPPPPPPNLPVAEEEVVEPEPTPEPTPESATADAGSTVEVEPEPAPPAVASGDPVSDEPGLTLVERLQPQPGDPRIWISFGDAQVEPTEEERARIMLTALLQNWNDSVAVAEAVRNRATDWSYTDAEGRRWGLASGRLHLGDYSIPLPALNIAPNRLADARQQFMLDDLARGAASAEMRQIQGDRARAIQERYEEERARLREASSPAAQPGAPDPQ